MSKRPTTVVFDMDNVLCRYHFHKRAYFSCEFGTAKPDPRVFIRLIEQLQIRPQETLFIDDTEAYITGATKAGLLNHHFRMASELRLVLDAYSLLT